MNTDFENSLKQILYRSVTCSIQQGQNEHARIDCQPDSSHCKNTNDLSGTVCQSALSELMEPYSIELSEHGQDVESVVKFALLASEGIRVSTCSSKMQTALIETLTAAIACLIEARAKSDQLEF
nr:hypothetical protein [uncultured Cohaesibacter sp.]